MSVVEDLLSVMMVGQTMETRVKLINYILDIAGDVALNEVCNIKNLDGNADCRIQTSDGRRKVAFHLHSFISRVLKVLSPSPFSPPRSTLTNTPLTSWTFPFLITSLSLLSPSQL